MLPIKCCFIWQHGFRGDDFLEIDQQETIIAYGSHLFYRSGKMIDASYQVSVHLAKWFQRRRFSRNDQPETRIAYGGHVC
jgi:hypothetical protein